MFDTVKVGKIIARKRKERNMTQLALADRLGVSFQAVSNWERGNSMPDISKLPELAELFECSIEELLGGGAPAAKVEQIAKEGADDLSLGDLAEVAPVLSPDLLDDAVQKASGRCDAADGGEGIVSLAPFLSQGTLGKLIAKNKIHGKQLVPLAPFLSGETLREAVLAALRRGEKIDKGLYPFLSEEIFSEILKTVGRKGN